MRKILVYISIVTAINAFTACTSCNNESKKKINNAVKTVESMKEKKSAEPSKEESSSAEMALDKKKPELSVLPNQPNQPDQPELPEEKVTAEDMGDMKISELKNIQPKIIEETQKIPECLEAAQTKEEAFACSKTLRELNTELALAMGDFSEQGMEKYDEDFVWNEETKINMIQEIEAGIAAMQDMQTCMEVSKTADELDECLKPEEHNESDQI